MLWGEYRQADLLKENLKYKMDWIVKAYRNKKFIEISAPGIKERHPHEGSIIKEAPNYQGHDK